MAINQAPGAKQPFVEIFPKPIKSNRAPSTTDVNHPIGQSWIYDDKEYVLVSKSSGSANWVISANSGNLTDITITTDSGTATFTSTGSVLGGGDTTTSGSGSTITVTTGGGGLVSLKNTPEWFDDFLLGTSSTGGAIGDIGWSYTSSGGSNGTQSEVGHPGIYSLSVDQVNDTASIRGRTFSYESFGSGETTVTYLIKLPNLSDGTDTYKVFVGYYDSSGLVTSSEGIYFTYTHGENSGNWTTVTSVSDASSTSADSGVAATTDWVELTFVVNAGATSVEYFIDGVSVGTIATTIPTYSGGDLCSPWMGIIKTVGTTSRSIYIDAFYQKIALTTSRFS